MNAGRKRENTILYYPTIKIEDGPWLRNALLYWDKVSSIVPSSNYKESNSVEVECLRDAGLYEAVHPAELMNDKILCKAFCEQVKKSIDRHRLLSICGRNTQTRVDAMKESGRSMVHIEKLTSSMLDFLIEEGIAERNCDGAWINMDNYDANIYMATLAKYIAKVHGNMEIGTDIEEKFFYPYTCTPIREHRLIDKQFYLNMAMQDILPVPREDVSIESIIDFKNHYKEPLRHFRHRMDEFQWSLKVCENIEDMHERMQVLQCEIQEDLEEIDNLMKSSGMSKSKKAFQICIPIAAEAGISLFEGMGCISSVQSVMSKVALNLFASFFCSTKQRQIDDKKAYLFYARKNGMIVPRSVDVELRRRVHR